MADVVSAVAVFDDVGSLVGAENFLTVCPNSDAVSAFWRCLNSDVNDGARSPQHVFSDRACSYFCCCCS